MGTDNESKIKKFLNQHQQGTITLAKWLESIGISHDLQKKYRKSGWLESIGSGAFKRPDENVGWQGAMYAMQHQAKLPIHPGATTALSIHGLSHYIRSQETIFLFSPQSTQLPRWFTNHKWESTIQHIKTSVLPEKTGLVSLEEKNFSILISGPERAMLECLHLAPGKLDLTECYQIMEGLSNLRPKLVQELLEKCSSIKVKRLFLFMATRAQHQWLNFIDQKKIDLGSGDRSITEGGSYNAAFHITIPKELAS
jgi:hypothetical protein